jgi:two-component system, NtrC family, sensor kinase
MNRFILICSFYFGIFSANAQNVTIDRLKNKLAATFSDTARCKILDSLSMYNMIFNNQMDSTLSYCNEYINTAFSIPDKKYLILAYARFSFYYRNVSLNTECLNMTYKGLDLSEEYHVQDYLSALYYDLGWFYINVGNTSGALAPALKGIAFLKFNKDPFFDPAVYLYAMVGNVYQVMNKKDSALYYFKRMDSLAAVSTDRGAKVMAYFYWAEYYSSYTKEYKKADSVSLAAIAECRKYGHYLISGFYIYLGGSSLEQGKIQKAFSYAKEAYAISDPAVDPSSGIYVSDLLSNCYKKSGKWDSAYHYLQLRDSFTAVVQQHGNATEVQQFEFDGQLRRREQEAATILQGQKNRSRILSYVFLTAVTFFVLIAMTQWRNNRQKKKANLVLQKQKQKVEITLQELKSTQAQLIQSEKMASLGELTAGIAHEIQNPLNFMNNFSEVNKELIEEMKQELAAGNITEATTIADNVQQNEDKINHHGKRADAIVKGMLQHSRTGTGQKEFADLNTLTDQYLRLAYHGMRVKDQSFNVSLETDLEKNMGKLNFAPQDFGRVLLNLYNNAFYAVSEKDRQKPEGYEPTVSVSTRKTGNWVEVRIKDNGNGIPQKVKDKIFQPFFTTKPTGQGTGLGLSLSYDIVKAHGGELKVESKEGEGAEFVIQIPTV